ncbi:hypothetical protein ABZ611_25120 [Streptomyces sp. NPDC007861]|uniref:hypothetical protein n=1 Tax=Streptomyces sp. NPDC007861 TaxID=3154893 RepID=UPI0033F5AFCE
MNEEIPPVEGWKRGKLERKADKLLDGAEPEAWGKWPEPWQAPEETEHDRIAVAYSGLIPLGVASLYASLPSYDPEQKNRELQTLMQERPGSEGVDALEALLDLPMSGDRYGSGFRLERQASPSERCRWQGCAKSLYGPKEARTKGRPRKYCDGHRGTAKARTRRLRYAGIQLGKNRNLVYDFPGNEAQDLQGYRDVWGRVNAARA